MSVEPVFPIFLTTLLAIPVVGMLIILITPRRFEDFIRWTALVFARGHLRSLPVSAGCALYHPGRDDVGGQSPLDSDGGH